MTQRIACDRADPAEVQLLAVTLLLLQALRRERRLELCIPRSVHDAMPPQAYAQILNDTLAAQYPDLETRLVLRVWAQDAFEMRTLP